MDSRCSWDVADGEKCGRVQNGYQCSSAFNTWMIRRTQVFERSTRSSSWFYNELEVPIKENNEHLSFFFSCPAHIPCSGGSIGWVRCSFYSKDAGSVCDPDFVNQTPCPRLGSGGRRHGKGRPYKIHTKVALAMDAATASHRSESLLSLWL